MHDCTLGLYQAVKYTESESIPGRPECTLSLHTQLQKGVLVPADFSDS